MRSVVLRRLLHLLQFSSMDDTKVSEEGQVSEVRGVTLNNQCTGNLTHRLKHWEMFIASVVRNCRITVTTTTVTLCWSKKWSFPNHVFHSLVFVLHPPKHSHTKFELDLWIFRGCSRHEFFFTHLWISTQTKHFIAISSFYCQHKTT